MWNSQDKGLQKIKQELQGKLLVEQGRANPGVHCIVWVSRSRYGQKPIRIGVLMADRAITRWYDYPVFHKTFLESDTCQLATGVVSMKPCQGTAGEGEK